MSSCTSPSSALMRPISVSTPVATATPAPCPAATIVPEKAMPLRSPSAASAGTAASLFSAATDSPVSTASSIRRPRALMSLRSAGTRSPASISTMSPGTISAAATLARAPSRTTLALGEIMLRMAASALSALPSCTKPTMAFTTTTATMTAASM